MTSFLFFGELTFEMQARSSSMQQFKQNVHMTYFSDAYIEEVVTFMTYIKHNIFKHLWRSLPSFSNEVE